MISLRLTYGPLLVLLYQAAPLQVGQDSLGRYRVTVGFAGGRWENEEFGCDGNLLSTNPVRHQSVGMQVDAWPSQAVRITAFGGTTHQNVGPTVPDTGYGYVERYEGPFAGAQIAHEGQDWGFGVGIAHLGGPDGLTLPTVYLRRGDLDGAHLRADVMTPNPALPSVGWGRFGVGYNDGHLRRIGGFVGLAMGPIDYNTKVALTGEIRAPIAHHISAQAHALWSPGENVTQWNAGFGLRYDFHRK